ncbi:MAG: hypothetical protein KTR25_11245 [Myxococcales bacterium]|nr:hypothetical protein [Myxococcales bacterium]
MRAGLDQPAVRHEILLDCILQNPVGLSPNSSDDVWPPEAAGGWVLPKFQLLRVAMPRCATPC